MKVVPGWMRRSVAPCVLAVALPAVLGPGAAAGTTRATPRIVCPMVAVPPGCCGPPVNAMRMDIVPCCPVPTVGCCLPTAGPGCCPATPCPGGLSIAASPDPASEAHAVTITGTLTAGTVAAQPVSLWERLAGHAAFAGVAHTTTNASGGFSFVRTVGVDAQWYAVSGSMTSATVDEPVLAAVALRASRLHPTPGARVKLSGAIAPSHAGERVSLQRLRAGRWVTIARPTLGARSRFSVVEKMRGRVVARFRAVLAADARNARSVSGVVAITPR